MSSSRLLLIALIGFSAASCDRAAFVQPALRTAAATPSRSVIGASVDVANVEQLYAAVNDPGNAGATIVLAPGTYVLSAKDPGGVARPNGGRIELQPDMSLSGVSGDRAAVVIDMSLLPGSSFNASVGKSSGIRIGRGVNSVEWLTILGNSNSTAGIETDLADSHPAQLRIAHVTAHASIRGVDVRNTGAGMSGRSIVASIEDNEFFGGTEGIRMLNVNGIVGARIDATLSGNRVHDNGNGCIVENNRSSSSTIHVRSSGDRFDHNGLGCIIGGGLVAAPGAANANTTTFEAYGDSFSDNTLASPNIDFGGVLVVGAETPGVPNSASHNTVTVALWGTKVSGNQNVDFQAFGARNIGSPTGISGTDNHATIELHGVSKQIDVHAVNSSPVDAGGTNTVTVVR